MFFKKYSSFISDHINKKQNRPLLPKENLLNFKMKDFINYPTSWTRHGIIEHSISVVSAPNIYHKVNSIPHESSYEMFHGSILSRQQWKKNGMCDSALNMGTIKFHSMNNWLAKDHHTTWTAKEKWECSFITLKSYVHYKN